tara:strand:+ start:2026 stop:3714 length:1689 start_codon:yes stop_codon:yes gene_type:complete
MPNMTQTEQPDSLTDEARLLLVQDQHGGDYVPNDGARGAYIKGAIIEGKGCQVFINGKGEMLAWTSEGTYTIAENENVAPRPVDLWAERRHPALPSGLLPSVIEDFATVNARIMGADAGALAASALAVCAAAIPDPIQVQVKRHSTSWTESARIWVALVGDPSAKKSPIISEASRPLKAMDTRLFGEYREAKASFDALEKAEQAVTTPPRQVRLRLEDTTIEAAQEVLKDSPNGVLCLQDELSGWFGAMDKYSGGRGAAKDRAFWLQSFNGGSYVVNRVGRGSSMIDNLSVCMLGGIQPEPIRKLAAEAQDDGLLQRLFPIVVSPSTVGVDEPTPPVSDKYAGLVERLRTMQRSRAGIGENDLRFDDGAQAIRDQLEVKHHDMQRAWEDVNRKLASHFGKLDGLFARLCVLWHCIESDGDRPAREIPASVADRVSKFMHQFLVPHAVAFYTDVLGLTAQHDMVMQVASYILSHDLTTITARDVRRGDRAMRGLDDYQARAILTQLDALGWLEPEPPTRNETAPRWRVRPSVHAMFAERAERERQRRQTVRETIVQSLETIAA